MEWELNKGTGTQKLFLADVMLGKLSRWMRLLGFDVEYLKLNQVDPESLARKSGRILLTRNLKTLKRCREFTDIECYNPDSNNPRRQLELIISEFGLRIPREEYVRCPVCNGSLNAINGEILTGEIPDWVRQHNTHFKKCSRCTRVYWRGTHGIALFRSEAKGPLIESVVPPNNPCEIGGEESCPESDTIK